MTMTFSEYCVVLKGSSRELSLADAAAQFRLIAQMWSRNRPATGPQLPRI